MTTPSEDEISAFYDRHPYPPPRSELGPSAAASDHERRVEHHRRWPMLPFGSNPRILVAGCGTSQAARWAARNPESRVVGIDVSSFGIDEHRRLAARHELDNLELHRCPIERVGELAETFDLIVCTGVLHHLADPVAGLHALRDVLAPTGAMELMVYATYGRIGVSMIQDYGRLMGLEPTTPEIADLIASLRELPLGHPLSHLLRRTPDFQDDDALADALLNPRERAYTVPEFFAFIGAAGMDFGRWFRQAPYLPDCGILSEVPHGPRIAALGEVDQYTAVELFRGTITRHSAILYRDDAPEAFRSGRWRPGSSRSPTADPTAFTEATPIRSTSAVVIQERLPPGTTAALLNRAHTHTDLVLFVDDTELARFEAIDGRRTIGQLAAGTDGSFFERLWRHDLIVVDTSG